MQKYTLTGYGKIRVLGGDKINGKMKNVPIWDIFSPREKLVCSDLVKFVMCSLVSRVHMTFYILTKGYTVPRN